MSNQSSEPTNFDEAYQLYLEYRQRYEKLENEFDEYQQSSLNYEQELEVQLKQLENQNQRLQQDLFIERTQNEQYRERTEQTIQQFDQRFDQIQDELNNCKNLNNKLTKYIRELEQTNDDLERSKRTLLDSLSTFETKLNYALEQNALLENELDDKKQLTETVQRLRDETRDLREELNVLHKTTKEQSVESPETPIFTSDRMQSILSESLTTTNQCTNRPALNNHNDKPELYISKTRTYTTAADLHISKGLEFSQPLSTSTRLESLQLINEAFRCFTNIETTLTNQRKHSQMTTTTNRSRYNSTTKTNDLLLNTTQS